MKHTRFFYSITFLVIFQISLAQSGKINNFNYPLFQRTQAKLHVEHKDKVGKYYGFYIEGENLEQLCLSSADLHDKYIYNEDLLLSIASSLQFLAIEHSIAAIGKYSYDLGIAKSEYEKYTNDLVNGYCSKNITSMSHKTIRASFIKAFKGDYNLPDFLHSPYFNKKIKSIIYTDDSKTKELFYTLNIFKSFCSWGQDVYNFSLMSPFLRSPSIVSYVARNMAGLDLKWHRESSKLSLVKRAEKGKRVFCRNSFCRKVSATNFSREFYKLNGSIQIKDSVMRNYCLKLRSIEKVNSRMSKKIKLLSDSFSQRDEKLMISQLIALFTKVPDLFIHTKKKEEVNDIILSDLKLRWDKWAKKSVDKSAADLFYEEPLIIEKVSRNKYYQKYSKDFNVEFDVNLGESDRAVERVGKVSMKFDVKIPKNLLRYFRMKQRTFNPRRDANLSYLEDILAKHIVGDLVKNGEKFILPIWNEQLARLISKEIITQADLYVGDFFSTFSKDILNIPIAMNFGPFALKYIYQRTLISNNQKTDKLLKIVE